jgi:hypothetical protein
MCEPLYVKSLKIAGIFTTRTYTPQLSVFNYGTLCASVLVHMVHGCFRTIAEPIQYAHINRDNITDPLYRGSIVSASNNDRYQELELLHLSLLTRCGVVPAQGSQSYLPTRNRSSGGCAPQTQRYDLTRWVSINQCRPPDVDLWPWIAIPCTLTQCNRAAYLDAMLI